MYLTTPGLCSDPDAILEPSASDLPKIIREFEKNNEKKHVYLISSDIISLWSNFQTCFFIIEAAGGLVRNPNGEWLVIERRGKWDIPKGKLEKWETPEEGAVREVKEETGLLNPKIISKLCDTHHTYIQDRVHILKTTYWFTMEVDNVPLLTPQSQEDIVQAIWVNTERAEELMRITYPSVAEVFRNALDNSLEC